MKTPTKKWKQRDNKTWWFHPTGHNPARGGVRICGHCNETFLAVRSSRQVYCSRLCSRAEPSKSEWRKKDDGWWYYTAGGHRLRGELRKCHYCGKVFPSLPSRRRQNGRFCSKVCSGNHLGKLSARTGKDSANWKGGRKVQRGYVWLYQPDHPSCQGTKHRKYVQEHRLVMEKTLGRDLESHERVHHINGDGLDNRSTNLELWATGHPNGVRIEDYHCPGCRCSEMNT